MIIIRWGNLLDTHPKTLNSKTDNEDIFKSDVCTQANAGRPLQQYCGKWLTQTEPWSGPWLPLFLPTPYSQNSYSAVSKLSTPQNRPNVTSKEECAIALRSGEPRRQIQIRVDTFDPCSRKSQIRQKCRSKGRYKPETHAREARPVGSP